MKYPFRWVALAAGVAVLLFSIVLAVNVTTDPRAELNTSRLLGKPAPEVALTRLDGTPVTSADLVGKTVIVNFWNSWCAPCKEELPILRQWYAAHHTDDSVVMLGIPRDDTPGNIRDAAATDGVKWTVANDQGARDAALSFATRGQPETFAISPGGTIAASFLGPVSISVLDRMLQYGQRGP